MRRHHVDLVVAVSIVTNPAVPVAMKGGISVFFDHAVPIIVFTVVVGAMTVLVVYAVRVSLEKAVSVVVHHAVLGFVKQAVSVLMSHRAAGFV